MIQSYYFHPGPIHPALLLATLSHVVFYCKQQISDKLVTCVLIPTVVPEVQGELGTLSHSLSHSGLQKQKFAISAV